MVDAYAQHGQVSKAIEVFDYMTAHSIAPNAMTFTALLNGFSHVGDLGSAQKLLSLMSSRFGLQPDTIHLNCIIDLYGRLGRLDDAERLVRQNPRAGIVSWMTLLGACRKFTDVKRAEHAFSRITAFPADVQRPHRSGAFVLMANTYAQAGDMHGRDRMRKQMEDLGVFKIPGKSCLQLSNRTVPFVADDPKLHENGSLHSMHSEMMDRLQRSGYVPDASVVTLGDPFSDRQRSVCYHSEKIAIAYGLLVSPPIEPLRITKNLRVCPDCHSATKLVTLIYGREIVLRDNSRHHHFKDGKCSCGDYW
jgi:pentatricopeptide repeat protein